MNPESAFVQAVVEAPDDTPRLIYADWLDEHGEVERAEFIRCQIEAAQRKRDSRRRREVAFRARQLLDQHEAKWTKPLRSLTPEWQFFRGFVEKLLLRGRDLKRKAEELFASYPLRRLRVSGLKGNVEPLRFIPRNNHLTGLDLAGNDLNGDSLRALVTLPNLEHLQVLGLLFNRIDDEAAEFMAEHPFFRRLALIRLGANPLGDMTREYLEAYLGKQISFGCERDEDHLYAIQDDSSFTTGVGAGHTQILMIVRHQEIRVALFDLLGNLLDRQHKRLRRGRKESWKALGERRERLGIAWLEELGFESATIRVKRFQFADGEGIRDFNWWAYVFETPDDPQAEELRESVAGWLADGQFEWYFGDDIGGDNCWLDRNGEVTDT
jgi:uncharacterized protein (TIGR02996 family)